MKAPTSGWRWGQRSRGRSQRRAASRVFGTTGAGPARHSSSICQPQTSARLVNFVIFRGIGAGRLPHTSPGRALYRDPSLDLPVRLGFPLGGGKGGGRREETRVPKTNKNYALGLRCECGASRSDGSRRLCAQCRYSKVPEATSGVQAATSPWWEEPDGVLARVRGDAAVVREIISLRGL